MQGQFAHYLSLLMAVVVGVGAKLGIASGDDQSGGPHIGIVAAASNTADAQTNTRYTDPRDKLMETGLFSAVTIINATGIGDGVGTPPLEELLEFDAILTWSNVSYDDPVSMGDNLADFVDAGGGVVVSLFANTSLHDMRYLQGRWQEGDYIAIPQNGDFNEGPGELGHVLIPDHPIFDGVESFVTNWGVNQQGQIFGGYRPNITSVTEGSTKVATWDTGHTLVALAPNPRVVELGFHPVSSDVVEAAYWDSSTDGARIIANALLYTIGETAPTCPADLTGDGVVDVFDLLELLGAWGECEPSSSCPADLTDDGVVDVFDLLELLSAWGEC